MKKRFIKVISSLVLFFFSVNLFIAPDSFAEKPCWNDGALSSGSGGVSGATGTQQGDINKKGATKVADPIDVSNGNYSYEKQDILIPSRGLPLQITRHYNSLDIYEGPLGIGWSHSYNIFLMSVSDGSQTYILRRNPDGSKDKFLQDTGGSYTSPPGCYDALVRDASGYVIYDKHGTRYSFDLTGRLKSITDCNSNQISLEYDAVTGVLTRITDSLGCFITFSYNSGHKVTSITDFAGRLTSYAYDADGNLATSTAFPTQEYPAGTTTTYSYDTQHRLTSITDPKGQVYLSLSYDENGRVVNLTSGVGVYSFNYQPNLTTMTDPKGFKTDYYLNPDSTVASIKQYSRYVRSSDPTYYQTRYEYNANRERAKIFYPKGNWVKYTYDNKGNFLELRKKQVYASDINDPQNDIVTLFTYEPRFNFIKTSTDPNANTTTYYYDYEEATLGDLNGDSITNQDKGNLVRISYPQVSAQIPLAKFTYNSYGQVLTATDPNGNITKYEYDPATGYLVKMTKGFGSSDASITEMFYDPVGNVTTIKDGRNNTTTFEYDSHNNLTKAITPAPFNYLTNYKYDANDNLIQLDKQTGDPANPWQTTYYTYDILDRLETIKDELNNITTFGYDANGNRSFIRDAELNSTGYTFDERNLLWKVTDMLNNVTEYSYDDNGNLSQIKDAKGNITGYGYDDFDRLTQTTYPDSTNESYSYDKSSNMTSKVTRKSNTMSYIYDALNRLTQKTTPEVTTDYTYDAGSRIQTVVNAGSTISYGYDALNRVKAVSYPQGKSVSYDYDPNGNRTKLTYPDSTYITYEYDNLNRLNYIKDQSAATIASYAYDALSRRTEKGLLNGTIASYLYDDINRLIDLTNKKGTIIISQFSYPVYDKVGNRKTMAASDGTYSYTYDNIYQLKTTDYPVASTFSDTTFNYDPVGNRSSTVNGGTTNYTPNNLNQYTQVGITTPAYDLNGNLTSIATNTYSYDSENRLITATTPSHNASYGCDAFGRRISKTVDGITTTYLYDGDDIIAEYDASGNLVTKYIYGEDVDEPIRMEKGGQSYYYHSDGLGSITNLTDSTGATIESYTYDVFGKPNTTSTLGNRYLFTGREYDSETGLYYYRERTYSPEIGRFLQTDPLGIDNENTYTYCDNSPTNYIDPYGLMSILPPSGIGIGLFPQPIPGGGFPLPHIPQPGENAPPNDKRKETSPAQEQDMSKKATNDANKKGKDDKDKDKGKKEDYPKDPNKWKPPKGVKEDPRAKEATNGKHRQWKDRDGNIVRRWDKGESGKPGWRGVDHWHDAEGGHIQ